MTPEYMQASAALIQAQGQFLLAVAQAEHQYAEVRKLDAETEDARVKTAALAEACRAMQARVRDLLRERAETREAETAVARDLRVVYPLLRGGESSLVRESARAFERLAEGFSGQAPDVPVPPGAVAADQFLHAAEDLEIPEPGDAADLARWMLAAGLLAKPGGPASRFLLALHAAWSKAFAERKAAAAKARAELDQRFGDLCKALGIHAN